MLLQGSVHEYRNRVNLSVTPPQSVADVGCHRAVMHPRHAEGSTVRTAPQERRVWWVNGTACSWETLFATVRPLHDILSIAQIGV